MTVLPSKLRSILPHKKAKVKGSEKKKWKSSTTEESSYSARLKMGL